MRSADHETSGRIDEKLGLSVYHLCRKDLIKYIFLNVCMNLLLGYFLIMLGRKNYCIQTLCLAVLIVLYGNLGLSIRAKVTESSILADLGQLT